MFTNEDYFYLYNYIVTCGTCLHSSSFRKIRRNSKVAITQWSWPHDARCWRDLFLKLLVFVFSIGNSFHNFDTRFINPNELFISIIFYKLNTNKKNSRLLWFHLEIDDPVGETNTGKRANNLPEFDPFFIL
ncbi:hypothetical protein BpHYR1_024298 [Brachionus plicatilis]|uniref:Uncharacterized protein n=1 Tax=Brachionus plicatilis TaxID=10195 RepID=A0A3M7SD34_BRAPC|nr:hypothetical protein BpHYR1_024298 [Brachionus plicatilis]